MVRRRKAHQVHTAATRGLLLRGRDKLLLAIFVVGLLAAWLVYGTLGGGAGRDSLTGPFPTSMAAARGPATPVPSATVGGILTTPQNLPSQAAAPSTAPPVVQGPVASAPQRISYPAARLDVVVHPLQPDSGDIQSQSIVPPETMDGYWLAPFGIPGAGSTNTTYVVGHSWEGIEAPFNRLSTMAAPGDELTVQTAAGAIAYKVDSVTTYLKSTLKDSPIWAVVPNRLVLISCYTGDLWGKNVAVVASPAAAP
ncbi:class F sortase [Arthrobacter sp. UYEF3]|uniref:class F sortase n=1 Tax=Arthrobacter sp. UYEF3 TaxID=1756365 RepID=UPI0033962220